MRFPHPLNSFKFLILLLFPVFLSGCAAVAVSALGAGAGVGLPYVFSDCAGRTLNFPFHQVDQATPKVLEKLDIEVLDHSEIEKGKRIKAATSNLEITIDMEKVTMRATRVTINAKKNALVKDKATAEEIINQLEIMLTPKIEKDRAPSPPRQKPSTSPQEDKGKRQSGNKETEEKMDFLSFTLLPF